MLRNITILDANGSAFFERQLEFIKAKSYDVVYQDLIAREVFPVSNEAPEGSSTITYRVYDQVGMAKIIASYASDLPRADITAKEVTIPVRAVGTSFGYNRDEIIQSQMTGLPLDQRRSNACQRAWEEVVDSVAWNGDAVSGLKGFFNNPNVPISASVTAGGWLAATPDEIILDVNTLMGTAIETTRLKERPGELLLPIKEYNHINGTPRSINSDTTILKFIMMNVEGLNSIRPVNELSVGVAGARSAFLYTNDPEKIQLEIVKELEFLPPQERGLELLVPAWGKLAGINMYYPLSAIELSGI